MSNSTLITITSLNLVISGITLGGLIYAGLKGRKIKKELEARVDLELQNAKTQVNANVSKLKKALDSFEL